MGHNPMMGNFLKNLLGGGSAPQIPKRPKGILLVPVQWLPAGDQATEKCVLYGCENRAYNTGKS